MSRWREAFASPYIAWWVPRAFEIRAAARSIPALFGDWRWALVRFTTYGLVGVGVLYWLSSIYGVQSNIPWAKATIMATLGVSAMLAVQIGILWLVPSRISIGVRGVTVQHGQSVGVISPAQIRRWRIIPVRDGFAVFAMSYVNRRGKKKRAVLGIPHQRDLVEIADAMEKMLAEAEQRNESSGVSNTRHSGGIRTDYRVRAVG